MSATLYVVSTFNLRAVILHRKEFPLDGLVFSPLFESVVKSVSSVAIDFDPGEFQDFGSQWREF